MQNVSGWVVRMESESPRFSHQCAVFCSVQLSRYAGLGHPFLLHQISKVVIDESPKLHVLSDLFITNSVFYFKARNNNYA